MTETKMRVYRHYITYRMSNARTLDVTSKYYLWVPANVALWVFPMDGYLPSLEVKDSDGNNLPILSTDEINRLIESQIKRELDIKEKIIADNDLKEMMIKQMGSEGKQPIKNNMESKHYVGILLPQINSNRFEEVTIKWNTSLLIKEKSKDGISLQIAGKHIIQHSATASTYVDIIVNDEKYEVLGSEIIATDDSGNPVKITNGEQYQEIQKEKARCVYRIRRRSPLTFILKWKIGLPKMIRQWAWAGFAVGIASILCSIFNFIHNPASVDLDVKILAGITALVIGFKWLIFHDSELMGRWNIAYLSLLPLSVSAILIISLIHYL